VFSQETNFFLPFSFLCEFYASCNKASTVDNFFAISFTKFMRKLNQKVIFHKCFWENKKLNATLAIIFKRIPLSPSSSYFAWSLCSIDFALRKEQRSRRMHSENSITNTGEENRIAVESPKESISVYSMLQNIVPFIIGFNRARSHRQNCSPLRAACNAASSLFWKSSSLSLCEKQRAGATEKLLLS
jgi:hypothetical protein